MSKAKSAKPYLHVIIGIVLAVAVALFVPPVNGLTRIGVLTLAVTVLTVYWWIFVGLSWTNLVSIALFAVIGLMPGSDILRVGFGNYIPILTIVSLVLNDALAKCGFIDRLIKWFITRKLVRGRPWLFTFMFFLAVYVVSCFLDIAPACLITFPFAKGILKEMGYGEDDKYTKGLLVGAMWCCLWGYAATPIAHSVTLVVMSLCETYIGVAISFVSYVAVMVPCTLLLTILTFLVVRLVVRPDTSKIQNFDVEAAAKSRQPWNTKEILTVVIFLAVVVCWFLPDILLSVAPGFSTFMKGLTMVIPAMLGIGAMCIIRVDGEPLLDFPKALSELNWTCVFLLVGMITLGAALSSEAAGITVLIQNLMTPLTASMTSWLPLVLIISAICAVLTNLMSNNVTAQLGCVAALPVILGLGGVVNPLAMCIAICVAANVGILTPAASGATALYLGTPYLTAKDIFKNGPIMVVLVIIVAVFVAYPLASVVLPYAV